MIQRVATLTNYHISQFVELQKFSKLTPVLFDSLPEAIPEEDKNKLAGGNNG